MVSTLEGTAEWPFNWTGCAWCGVEAPPPDTILQIPPPPLPHFLQLSLLLDGSNHSSVPAEERTGDHFLPPCNPHCDGAGSAGVEFVELSRRGVVGAIDDTWFLVLIASSVAFILLGALLTVAFLRWRQQRNMKSQMEAAAKVRPLDNCCGQANDQHALWAALTAKGTPAHFAVPPERRTHHGVDFCRPSAPGFGYYGAIEPHFPHDMMGKSQPGTPDSQIYTEIPDVMLTKLSSYDDYAYEDPLDTFPMGEASRQHTLSHYGTARPLVSPPTKIDASSLPPLNQKRQRNLPNI